MLATARFRTTHGELRTAHATNASRQSCDQDQRSNYQRNGPTVSAQEQSGRNPLFHRRLAQLTKSPATLPTQLLQPNGEHWLSATEFLRQTRGWIDQG